jgi:integrase
VTVERLQDDRTMRPFTPTQRRQILAAVRSLPDVRDIRWPWIPRRALLFLYYTGAHPEVLVHPRRRHLEVRPPEGDQGARIQWFRPKTRTPMDMPVTAELAPWIEDFVRQLVEPTHHVVRSVSYTLASGEVRSREQDFCYLEVTRMVEKVMAELGLPGFSPRSFRHDRAKRVLDVRHNPVDVQVYVGVSPGVVARYAGAKDPVVDRALREE